MVQPLPWDHVNQLIGQNVFRRYRIKEPVRTKREHYVNWMTSTLMGRWGHTTVDDSLIVGVEDPEDILQFKLMFFKSFKKQPIT